VHQLVRGLLGAVAVLGGEHTAQVTDIGRDNVGDAVGRVQGQRRRGRGPLKHIDADRPVGRRVAAGAVAVPDLAWRVE